MSTAKKMNKIEKPKGNKLRITPFEAARRARQSEQDKSSAKRGMMTRGRITFGKTMSDEPVTLAVLQNPFNITLNRFPDLVEHYEKNKHVDDWKTEIVEFELFQVKVDLSHECFGTLIVLNTDLAPVVLNGKSVEVSLPKFTFSRKYMNDPGVIIQIVDPSVLEYVSHQDRVPQEGASKFSKWDSEGEIHMGVKALITVKYSVRTRIE